MTISRPRCPLRCVTGQTGAFSEQAGPGAQQNEQQVDGGHWYGGQGEELTHVSSEEHSFEDAGQAATEDAGGHAGHDGGADAGQEVHHG